MPTKTAPNAHLLGLEWLKTAPNAHLLGVGEVKNGSKCPLPPHPLGVYFKKIKTVQKIK
jgi:hypothetical protein